MVYQTVFGVELKSSQLNTNYNFLFAWWVLDGCLVGVLSLNKQK